jgi:hypothetical protein
VIDADIFVAELGADLIYRLDRMHVLDLARALSRRGLSEDKTADIIRRFDILRDSDEEAVS